jgi:hypothetical protein
MRVLGAATCALLFVALFCPSRASARGKARANAQLSATVEAFVQRFYTCRRSSKQTKRPRGTSP